MYGFAEELKSGVSPASIDALGGLFYAILIDYQYPGSRGMFVLHSDYLFVFVSRPDGAKDHSVAARE